MQDLFQTEISKFPKHHRGLRNIMINAIELFYIKRKRLPELARKRPRGSDFDRATLLEENKDIFEKYKKSSILSTYSWSVREVVKYHRN